MGKQGRAGRGEWGGGLQGASCRGGHLERGGVRGGATLSPCGHHHARYAAKALESCLCCPVSSSSPAVYCRGTAAPNRNGRNSGDVKGGTVTRALRRADPCVPVHTYKSGHGQHCPSPHSFIAATSTQQRPKHSVLLPTVRKTEVLWPPFVAAPKTSRADTRQRQRSGTALQLQHLLTGRAVHAKPLL